MDNAAIDDILKEIRLVRSILLSRIDGPIASLDEIRSKFGDGAVRFDPKGWKGPSCKGKKFSQCPPAFLDALAGALTAMAASSDRKGEEYNGQPKSKFSRLDAARARRWAIEKRIAGEPEDGPPAAPAPPRRAFGQRATEGTPATPVASPPAPGPAPFDDDESDFDDFAEEDYPI